MQLCVSRARGTSWAPWLTGQDGASPRDVNVPIQSDKEGRRHWWGLYLCMFVLLLCVTVVSP